MLSTTYTIRLDQNLKRDAKSVAEYYGFDLGAVTRAFYSQMVRENSIPLNLTDEKPNRKSKQALKEAENFFSTGKTGRFASAEEIFNDVGV